MDKGAVLRCIGIALGAEADNGRVLLIRYDLHNTVGDNRFLIQHKGDYITGAQLGGIDLFIIEQRADMIGRLHRAGKHGIHLQAKQPDTRQRYRQKHHRNHQHRGDHIPDLFYRCFHWYLCTSLSQAITR